MLATNSKRPTVSRQILPPLSVKDPGIISLDQTDGCVGHYCDLAFYVIECVNSAEIKRGEGKTVNFIHWRGQLRRGDNKFLTEFRNAQGQLVDVGDVKFDMDMNMLGMQMHSGSTIERTNTPGRYRAKIKIDMAGDSNAKISFDGPHGHGQASFSMTAK